MHTRVRDIIFVLIVLVLWGMVSFPFNGWFSSTMPRHQVLQLPSMLLLGLGVGWWFPGRFRIDAAWASAIFIYTICSLAFWMLPHSIDRAVIQPWFNRIMHVNMFSAGIFLIPAFKMLILELKIFLFGMIAAMVIATGYTLMHYDVLLCSAFDIVQQRQTGEQLLVIGIILFALNIINFFRLVGKGDR